MSDSAEGLARVLVDPPAAAIVPPAEGDGPEAWDRFYAALGRPEAPEGYVFSRPEGGAYDERLAGWFRQAAHRNGLSAKAAAGLHDAFVAEAARQAGERGQSARAEAGELEQALRQEWGPRYEGRVALARRTAARFADGADLAALEEAVGAPALVRLFARIGESLAEDRLSGEGGGRALSAEGARARRGQLTRDTGFLAAFLDRSHPGHREALREMEGLNRAIAGDRAR